MLDAYDKAGYEKSRMLFLAAIHANTLNPVFSGLDGLMGFVLLASRSRGAEFPAVGKIQKKGVLLFPLASRNCDPNDFV